MKFIHLTPALLAAMTIIAMGGALFRADARADRAAPAPLALQDSGEKTLLNVDQSGLALQGYDPVAYFTQSKAVKGDAKITSSFRGATYRFASQEHKALFDADPAKYEPAFGGYCGFGVSRGYLVEIDPEAFVIQDGRLILQYSKGVLRDWKKDPAGYLAKALRNWPELLKKNGK